MHDQLAGPYGLLKAEIVGSKKTFALYRAMRALSEEVARFYDQQLAAMRAHLDSFVQAHVHVHLAKAELPPLFTVEQFAALREIIDAHHAAVIGQVVGTDMLLPAERERLARLGIQMETAHEAITLAFRYGMMLGSAHQSVLPSVRNASMQTVAVHAVKYPITVNEQHAIDWAKLSAANELRGLGNRVAEDFTTIAIEADREARLRHTEKIREVITEGMREHDTWRKIASELGHQTTDWARDFQRIAATEKQKAMQEGITTGLIKKHGDPKNIRVAKQPNPDACKDCIRLHLDGARPRIFLLSDLIANGTNVGRRRENWKPVVGAVHPWCGCELVHVPEGWDFDEDGNLKPKKLTRSGWLESDLRKAEDMTYGESVPLKGVTIRVADPQMREAIEDVIARTPPEIFDKEIGVTLITTDHPRVQNPLDEHDYAYWTGNEIRLMQTLDLHRVSRVVEHELGHSLNVHLTRKLGGVAAVRKWHDQLWDVSRREGWVSNYAKREPIENAAEVTRLYLYNRRRLMLRWPRQFAFLHQSYKDIWSAR